jgi:hypothetical protein
MNAKQRCKARRHQRRAAERAEASKDSRLSNTIAAAITGSERVAKALALCEFNTRHEYSGAMCLPQVALYSAGYRKSESLTAR